jgi:osmotically-inducible protein OsmY
MASRDSSRSFDTEQGHYRSGNYGYEDQLYKIGTGATLYRKPREQEEQTHGPHAGRGPKNYIRSDARIGEEINERLTDHPMLDATKIEFNVEDGYVTLKGTVGSRVQMHLAEDLVLSVRGVRDVDDQLRVDAG